MQYNRDRKGKTESLKEMRRRNRRKWDWEKDKSDWANSRKFPIGTVGDIECEPRTFNKHTLLSKEQLRCWNMVLYLYYWGYMYVIFQYREFTSCSKWHPVLLLSSLIETDYVQTLLIYVTADFMYPQVAWELISSVYSKKPLIYTSCDGWFDCSHLMVFIIANRSY